jgi:hypothetical protein
VLTAGSSWAAVVGSTDPGAFGDPVDWCQLGCGGGQLATPQPWTSAGLQTGTVGLVDTGQGFYNLLQGTSWFGNFASGMGLVFNGVDFGNTPTDIALTFDQGESAVGAYIQANWFGGFTATIMLYDVNYQLLGTFSAGGTSGGTPGTALFIGAFDTTDPIWAAQFNVVDQFGKDDFSIGTAMVGPNTGAPEPESLVLMGSALLGLAGFIRRRRSLKSEVK